MNALAVTRLFELSTNRNFIQDSAVNLAQAIQRLYDLNCGIIGSGEERHERPHKPLLLLATRQLMREALVSRYFPHSLQIKNHQSSIGIHQSDPQVAEHSRKTLLLPKDEAFHPEKDGLEWRCDRLIA